MTHAAPAVPTPAIERISSVIERLLSDGFAVDDSGRQVRFGRYAVNAEAGALLEAAAAAAPPGDTVEVGMASGLSTLFVARGRLSSGQAGAAHVMDPEQSSGWLGNIGRRAVRDAGLDGMVRFVEDRSDVVLPRLVDEGVRAGFAFVDGFHVMDYVLLECHYIDRMLVPGGVIAIHDLWMPGLQHAASFWLANRSYEPVTLRDGVLVNEAWVREDGAYFGAGDVSAWSGTFRRRVAPFVEHSVLFMRKLDEDRRAWDAFEPFA